MAGSSGFVEGPGWRILFIHFPPEPAVMALWGSFPPVASFGDLPDLESRGAIGLLGLSGLRGVWSRCGERTLKASPSCEDRDSVASMAGLACIRLQLRAAGVARWSDWSRRHSVSFLARHNKMQSD